MRYRLLKRLVIYLCLCFMVVVSSPAMAGDFIYTAVNNALQIIDCRTDTVVKTIPHNDYILSAAFSPDGKRYFMNAIHSIYAYDTATHKLIDHFNFSFDLNRVSILAFAVSNNGKKLYLSCTIVKKKQNIPKLNVLPPQLVVFDLKTKKIVKNFEIPHNVLGVIPVENDSSHVILLGLDVHKLNLKNGKVTTELPMLHVEKTEDYKNFLLVNDNRSPGDHGIFSSPYYTAALELGYLLIDRKTGKIDTLKGEDAWFAYSTIISPDKKYLYAVMDELVKIDMQTGKTVGFTPLERGTGYALSLTSDGKKIYAGPGGADISVYDAETLKPLGVIALAGDGKVANRLTR